MPGAFGKLAERASGRDRHGEEYERKTTTRWIGSVIRKKLQLTTRKSHGNYTILPEELGKLDRLCERYGITTDESAEAPANTTADAEGLTI